MGEEAASSESQAERRRPICGTLGFGNEGSPYLKMANISKDADGGAAIIFSVRFYASSSHVFHAERSPDLPEDYHLPR
jgi:hypothetical protein